MDRQTRAQDGAEGRRQDQCRESSKYRRMRVGESRRQGGNGFVLQEVSTQLTL